MAIINETRANLPSSNPVDYLARDLFAWVEPELRQRFVDGLCIRQRLQPTRLNELVILSQSPLDITEIALIDTLTSACFPPSFSEQAAINHHRSQNPDIYDSMTEKVYEYLALAKEQNISPLELLQAVDDYRQSIIHSIIPFSLS